MTWKALITSRSEMGTDGQVYISFDLLLDEEVKYKNIELVTPPSDEDVSLAVSQRSNQLIALYDADTASTLKEGSSIILTA